MTTPADQYDVPPAAALERLAALPPGTPVILDLDETLLLENSSERFVDAVRPALLGRLVLLLLDRVKPWRRLGGGNRHRDLIRIRTILLLFPWTLNRWQRSCSALAQDKTNVALLAATGLHPRLVVTFGYTPVVTPLVEAMLPGVALVSSALSTADRDQGKLAMIEAQAPGFPLAAAAVVTDSMDDAELLAAVAHPMRVLWPEASVQQALQWVYLPLFYLERMRRPGARYFLRGVVQDELAVVLLAALPLAFAPLPLAAGLCLLCLSFWCFYEQGYVDNDVMSSLYEDEHVRPRAREWIAYGTPWMQALVWSAAFAIPGVLLCARGTAAAWTSVALTWVTVLAMTAAVFTFYNRIQRRGRIVFISALHALRAFSLPAVAAICIPGFFMLVATMVTRQIEDYARKTIDRKAKTPDLFVIMLQLYVILFLGYGVMFHPPEPLYSIQGATFLAYGLLRARGNLVEFLRSVHWVWWGKSR